MNAYFVTVVELENHKAEYAGTDEEGNLVFKDMQTFDELKVKPDDVDDRMRGWLGGTASAYRFTLPYAKLIETYV